MKNSQLEWLLSKSMYFILLGFFLYNDHRYEATLLWRNNKLTFKFWVKCLFKKYTEIEVITEQEH